MEYPASEWYIENGVRYRKASIGKNSKAMVKKETKDKIEVIEAEIKTEEIVLKKRNKRNKRSK